MKNLLFSMLLMLTLVSCSSDEVSTSLSVDSQKTFVLASDKELDLISIRIMNSEGETLNIYNYQNTQSVSLDIIDGNEIMIYTINESPYTYNYIMFSNNDINDIDFQGIEEAEGIYTISYLYSWN